MEQMQTPRAIDEMLARLHAQADLEQRKLSSAIDMIHSAAGDRHEYHGRRQFWKRTYAEVLRDVKFMVQQGNPYIPMVGKTPAEILTAESSARNAVAETMLKIQKLDLIYTANPWSRFFPCDTRDGHIHSSERGCSTIRVTTAMRWRPDLSGKTVAEAVAELGEALCTFCYPGAPSDWKAKTLGQVKDERTRAEREAVKAERQAKRDAKQLRRDERFRVDRGRYGERIETVAACKDALRRERELFYYYGRGPHCDHEAWAWAAGKAQAVLLLRESAHPGWGATQAEIDKIIANADKKHSAYVKEQS
jgi:hypothetical protein